LRRAAKASALLRADPEWAILLDESGSAQKRDPRGRLLVAVRRQPLACRSRER